MEALYTAMHNALWRMSYRADPVAASIADRHYNRQKIGAPQFVPPGRCIVLVTPCQRALWVTSWPIADYVKHEWAGAWINSLFRNEGAGLSSQLIVAAVAAVRALWDPPEQGLVTFIDRSKVRHKRDYGRCYLRAGFEYAGETMCGLLVLRLSPDRMPTPMPALGAPFALFDGSFRRPAPSGREATAKLD